MTTEPAEIEYGEKVIPDAQLGHINGAFGGPIPPNPTMGMPTPNANGDIESGVNGNGQQQPTNSPTVVVISKQPEFGPVSVLAHCAQCKCDVETKIQVNAHISLWRIILVWLFGFSMESTLQQYRSWLKSEYVKKCKIKHWFQFFKFYNKNRI